LKSYSGTDDWQCRFIGGKCFTYVVLRNAEKQVPYGELVGITECIML